MDNILISGIAGFIGFHLTLKLSKVYPNAQIIGIDNLNDYYDVRLKEKRLSKLKDETNVVFIKGDITDLNIVEKLFDDYKPKIVIHLAAQAGVRYSLTNPKQYIESNIVGFHNILESCRKHSNDLEHLLFASSSSVYGDTSKHPQSESDITDVPKSLYAATKKSNELMAYSYSSLYHIPTTSMRFFTVYGPYGRPDMAYYSFADNLTNGKKIKLYNNGLCERDFTYVDDIVESIARLMKNPSTSKIPYDVYNIGRGKPVSVFDFVTILTETLKKENLLPKSFKLEDHIELHDCQLGDVERTYADTKKLESAIEYKPRTNLNSGLLEFAKWYSQNIKESEAI